MQTERPALANQGLGETQQQIAKLGYRRHGFRHSYQRIEPHLDGILKPVFSAISSHRRDSADSI
jgi:hypothetical protein